MLDTRTLDSVLKARGWSRSELARRVGVSRQAVSLWFRAPQTNVQSKHLMRLAEVLGMPAEDLAKPLPCFDAATHDRLRATLLWDRLFPDIDDLAVALNARDPRAVARFVQVYGLYAGEATLGPSVWENFPDYKRHIHPARRVELETLWDWHKSRTAA